MANWLARRAALVVRARCALGAAFCLLALSLAAPACAQDDEDPFADSPVAEPSTDDSVADEPPAADPAPPDAGAAPSFLTPSDHALPSAAQVLDPHVPAAHAYEPLIAPAPDETSPYSIDESAADDLRPFDWMRHWGFHHSSTEGPFLDRGVPMERASWLNRPYHLDWFVGPLLSDGPAGDRVEQSNDVFGGLRLGWDFDYYWGLEWRFGWSDPVLIAEGIEDEREGDYFVSDFDFIYYPWGDTKVRPYVQWGLGLTQISSIREDGSGQDATLLSMPMGIGIQFPQTHWLAWRLEIIDNLAFGADGVDTMNNFAFTAGMEFRMGARPNSYWPWRSSRKIW